MGKTSLHSVNIDERDRKGVAKKHLTTEQIREIQEAINEFFLAEKERMVHEKEELFRNLPSNRSNNEMDDDFEREE
ncbi:MAG: hypothetical protein JW971_03380 [Synergistales bacterium]|nr:hypothetical protein [Synergistales bacterium]